LQGFLSSLIAWWVSVPIYLFKKENNKSIFSPSIILALISAFTIFTSDYFIKLSNGSDVIERLGYVLLAPLLIAPIILNYAFGFWLKSRASDWVISINLFSLYLGFTLDLRSYAASMVSTLWLIALFLALTDPLVLSTAKNSQSKQSPQQVYEGFSWTFAFFGPLSLLFRGDTRGFVRWGIVYTTIWVVIPLTAFWVFDYGSYLENLSGFIKTPSDIEVYLVTDPFVIAFTVYGLIQYALHLYISFKSNQWHRERIIASGVDAVESVKFSRAIFKFI
jgi:hypothetical protein